MQDELTDAQLRTLVITTLDRNPDATFEDAYARLRSAEGRSLGSAETERLRGAFDAELAHPTGAHRIGAAEAVTIAANQPFAVRWPEIAGLVFGLIPFVFHLQTTTPSTVARGTGAIIRGGVYDLAAIAGGFIAVVFAVFVARSASQHVGRPLLHFAMAGAILILGVYQSLLGLGVLHYMGVFKVG